jgi:rhomboid family GlyGly-CTERM serine protease
MWVAVALLMALPAAATGALTGFGRAAAIDWQPALWWPQPWRWWSAAWVHYSAHHLAVNLAGAALVAAFGVAAQVPARAAMAWALAWPITHLALLSRPGLDHYGGLSGVLHAGVAVACISLLRCDHGRRGLIGALVLIGLVLKVLTEAPWAAGLPHSNTLGITTAPWAHLCGLLAGVLAALGLVRPAPR